MHHHAMHRSGPDLGEGKVGTCPGATTVISPEDFTYDGYS